MASHLYRTFEKLINDPTNTQKSPHIVKSDKTYTMEEAIEHIGFGRFQVKLAMIMGFAWMADSMEIMLLAILGPLLACEWDLNPTQQAMFTTSVFLGIFSGSPVMGSFADYYGRKSMLLFCSAWSFWFGILSGLAPNYIWLLTLRGLVGFGIAGAQTGAVTYFSEFLPVKSRKIVVMQSIFWTLGAMMEVIMALLMLKTAGWRWWMVMSAVPLLIFMCLYWILPPSPRYLIICGRLQEADKVLHEVARENKVEMLPGKLIHYGKSKKRNRAMLTDIFNKKFKKTSLFLLIIWFSSASSYYGTVLLTTQMIHQDRDCLNTGMLLPPNHLCSLECKTLSRQDLFDILITAAAEIPAIFIALFLVDVLGRRWTMGTQYAGFSVCMWLLFICVQRDLLLVILFTARGLIQSAIQVAWIYTPEVYPTEVRCLATGFLYGCGRLGAIITPFVAVVLLAQSLYAGLAVYGVSGIAAAIATALLPFETKGKPIGGV